MATFNYSGTIERYIVFYYIKGQNLSLSNFEVFTSSPFVYYPFNLYVIEY